MPTTATDRTPEASPEGHQRQPIGNPEVSPLEAYNESARQRLMEKAPIADTPHPRLGTPCWNHEGGIFPKGGHRYFHYSHDGVDEQLAHRVSYRIHKGDFPKELHVRHLCGNAACVNPDHLELGTHQQNMSDKALMSDAPVRAQSGIRGVYQTAHGTWQAVANFMNKAYTKCHKLKEDAIAWREAKLLELHGLSLVAIQLGTPSAAPAP